MQKMLSDVLSDVHCRWRNHPQEHHHEQGGVPARVCSQALDLCFGSHLDHLLLLRPVSLGLDLTLRLQSLDCLPVLPAHLGAHAPQVSEPAVKPRESGCTLAKILLLDGAA